ncbi:MAG: alkaline phosphatase family protein [Armatimonadota bacterium]
MPMDPFDELLKQYHYPGPQRWVMPAYGGRSTINLMRSLLAYYGVEAGMPLAFHEEFAAALRGRRKIQLLLLDGLGWTNLEEARGRPIVDTLVRAAWRWPITTVFPSTTTAALSSYLSALPPSQHGIIGFSMYLPEYGRTFNMLNLHSLEEDRTDLLTLGFVPEDYIGHPSVLKRLRDAGVMAGGFVHSIYAFNGLSRITYHDYEAYPYLAPGDLVGMTMDQLGTPLPVFQFVYWSHLDTIAHTYGPRSNEYLDELQMLATIIMHQLLPRMDNDTALIICADHGHLEGKNDPVSNLADLPELVQLFRAAPAGEGLAQHIFLQPGTETRARELLSGIDELTILTREEFFNLRLLGDPPYHPGLLECIGDLILLPHGPRRFLYQYQRRPHTSMHGRHGGMTPEQMVVPLMVL